MAPPGRVLIATTNRRAQAAFRAVLGDARPLIIADSASRVRAQISPGAVWSLILIDAALPGERALRLLGWIRRQLPWTALAVLVSAPDKQFLNEALELNTAVLPLPIRRAALRAFLQRVFASEASSNEQVQCVLAARFQSVDLSARECALVVHAVSGLDRETICRRRGIKPNTLANEITRLLARFGARNMNELALDIFRAALLTDPTPVSEWKPLELPPPPEQRKKSSGRSGR